MQRASKWLGVFAVGLALIGGWQVWSSAQQPAAEKGKEAATADRPDFEVVHSFDGKYLDDTPGHMGRVGGLTTRRPRVALADRVYRGEEQVGIVTGLDWNRTNNSLDIEFDPVNHARVCVGETVWVQHDGGPPAKAK